VSEIDTIQQLLTRYYNLTSSESTHYFQADKGHIQRQDFETAETTLIQDESFMVKISNDSNGVEYVLVKAGRSVFKGVK